MTHGALADVMAKGLKACVAVTDADRRQLLNYLRLTRMPLGLLLHFGPTEPTIVRVVNSFR